MRVNIEITKRYFLIICVIIVLCSGLIVYAYGGGAGNPSIMGHTSDEITFASGVFSNIRVFCEGGVVDEGDTFTCYDPKGIGFFGEGLTPTPIGGFQNSTNAVCLALGGEYVVSTEDTSVDPFDVKLSYDYLSTNWEIGNLLDEYITDEITCHR